MKVLQMEKGMNTGIVKIVVGCWRVRGQIQALRREILQLQEGQQTLIRHLRHLRAVRDTYAWALTDDPRRPFLERSSPEQKAFCC